MNVVILHFMSPAQMKDKALHGIVLIVNQSLKELKMSRTVQLHISQNDRQTMFMWCIF